MDMCGAPEQTIALPAHVNPETASILQGKVLAGADPVGGAFVRLLDATGEFTAEVVSSPQGDFRFFAAPGDWTVRALSRSGNGQATVAATTGLYSVDVLVS